MGSVWINLPIGIVIIVAIIGIPLWLVLRRREAAVGHGASTALSDSDQLGPAAKAPDATPQSGPEIRVSPSGRPRRRRSR